MGFSKSLLDIDGRVAATVIVAKSRPVTTPGSIVIVTHAGDEELLQRAVTSSDPSDARIVVNLRPELGRTGSLQQGLRALTQFDSKSEGPFDATWIWPVDTPCVQSSTLDILRGSLDRLGRFARVIPVTNALDQEHTSGRCQSNEPGTAAIMRGGHPILIGSEWWPQIERMGADQPLRDVLAMEPERVERVVVDDPAVLWNFNTPAEVERRLGRPARLLLPLS